MRQREWWILAPLLVVFLGLVWLLWPRGPEMPSTAAGRGTADAGAPRRAGVERTGGELAEAGGAVPRRDTATAVPAVDSGLASLRVRAVWPDAEGAAGVMIYLRRGERYLYRHVLDRGVTDEVGVVEFHGVRPGTVRLRSDRGDRESFDVEAGIQDVTFELGGGVAVEGRVVDPAGRGVAGAEVWLQTRSTNWAGGRVVATADAHGEFSLRQLDPTLSLGAFAPGLAPSALVDLDVVDTSRTPVQVVLALEPGGGRLVGRVTSQGGGPVSGALVAVGSEPGPLDHQGQRVVEEWSARTGQTDADGRFVLAGLPTGTMPVAIRAAGHGLWRDEVAITAGEETVIAPELAPGARISGRVTDGVGSPEAGAVVRAYDRAPDTSFLAGGHVELDETFGGLVAIADEDGRYRLDDVTPGTVHALAQRGSADGIGVSVAHAQAELEAVAGEELEWNPVIDDGRAIEGIVLYRDGYPMPHKFVTLENEQTGEEHVMMSDGEGAFRFLCLENGTYAIRVQQVTQAPDAPPLRTSGVVPDRGRVELRATYDRPVEQLPGTVVGRVDDAGGRIARPRQVRVMLFSDARWLRDGGGLDNGLIRFEKVRPCRFRLSLMEGTKALAHSDWFEVRSGKTTDVGALTTVPGGSLRVVARRGEGAATFEPTLYLQQAGEPVSTQVELGRASECVVDNLSPGDYELRGYARSGEGESARHMVPLRAEATVEAGAVREVAVAIRCGARCELAVWWPPGACGSETYRYRIFDAEDDVLREFEGPMGTLPTRPRRIAATVPPGRWHFEFTTDDGLRGESAFEVGTSLDAVSLRVDLEPR